MPYGNYIFAPPLPEVIDRFCKRPELRGSIYLLRGDRFPMLPPKGIAIIELPTSRQWRHAEEGPYWYKPDEYACEPPEPFRGSVPEDQPSAELVFDPLDLARRFKAVAYEMPPRALLEFCKGIAEESEVPIGWYTWLERGDALYHDAAWIFGRLSPTEVVPGVTFTPAGQENEEFVIFEGDTKGRGWLLWGNKRAESSYHDTMAMSRLGLYFPTEGIWRILDEFCRDPSWDDHLYLPNANARMSRLRALLHDVPSPRVWASICALIDNWPASEDREVGLRYALAHSEHFSRRLACEETWPQGGLVTQAPASQVPSRPS